MSEEEEKEMAQIINWIELNVPLVIIILGAIQVLFIFIMLFSLFRLAKGAKPYRRLAKEIKEGSVEMILLDYLKKVNLALERVEQVEKTVKRIEQITAKSISRVSLIRFNAFADVGSNLSFSAAFLDSHGDGIVLTSIYGRDESRPYAKVVQHGKSSFPLSLEEEEAIKQALNS